MKVSVVVATKNAEKYIINQLESVRNQTFSDFDCIIIDDHSTDSTVSIVNTLFCKNDSRFKLYANITDENLPFVDAHMKLYELAKGELIVHIDQDDVCVNTMLEKFVSYMDAHNDIDAVCGKLCLITYDQDNGVWVRKEIDYDREITEDEKKYLHNPSRAEDDQFIKSPAKSYSVMCNLWTHQCFCVRASVMREIIQKGIKYIWMPLCECVFFQRIIASGYKVSKITDPMLYWRDNSMSLSHSGSWNYQDNLVQYVCAYCRLLMLVNNMDEDDVPIFKAVYKNSETGIEIMKKSCIYFLDKLKEEGRCGEIPEDFKDYILFT